ncbi:MAG: diguanylate cyclase [Gammaproteobacteria bacterium]|nr:diguanylate cyclase [Gammaproteobacteria bacterium]
MRLLLASQDSVTTPQLEKLALSANMDIFKVEEGREAVEFIRTRSPTDLVLVDAMLSGIAGIELVERLRRDDKWSKAVIVFIANDSDSGAMRQARRAGADDCLLTPANEDELRLRFDIWQKLCRLQETVNQGTSHDAVTGLYSHGLVLETAQHELDRAIREETPLSMVMTDIDNLRQINEKYGHQMGDKVLAMVAERMKVALRSYDLSGRYGGEEFLTVLPRCGRANAMEVGERIRRAVAAEPLEIDSIKLPVTVSIGVVTTMGDEDVSARKMIRAADHALFKAKREGRNRVEMAVSLKTWAGRSI